MRSLIGAAQAWSVLRLSRCSAEGDASIYPWLGAVRASPVTCEGLEEGVS